MAVIGLASILLYSILIAWVYHHWRKPEKKSDGSHRGPLSIIIPARNEELLVESCLNSCTSQSGLSSQPQVIFVDDHSEDDTSGIVMGMSDVLAYANKGRGKKDAIRTGVEYASGGILMFTDADCIVPDTWASTMTSHLETESLNMVTGIVKMTGGKGFIEQFQKMDNANTMAFTHAGIKSRLFYSANGANMIVRKAAYLHTTQAPDYDAFQSGDDMFLINYLAQDDPSQVGFVKAEEAAVSTPVVETITDFWQQRKRWATKALHMPGSGLSIIQSFVLYVNILVPVLFIVGLFKAPILGLGMALGILKLIIDYVYFYKLKETFSLDMRLTTFLKAELYYPYYILRMAYYALSGGKYQWKNRTVDK